MGVERPVTHTGWATMLGLGWTLVPFGGVVAGARMEPGLVPGFFVVLAVALALFGMVAGIVQITAATKAWHGKPSARALQAWATGLGLLALVVMGLESLIFHAAWVAAGPLVLFVLQVILQAKAPWTSEKAPHFP